MSRARAGTIRPPAGGRAPGWRAGLVVARREEQAAERTAPSAGAERRGSWINQLAVEEVQDRVGKELGRPVHAGVPLSREQRQARVG